MGIGVKLSVTGVSNVEEASRQVRKAIADKLNDILMAGGKIIETEAKAIVPVRTGALQRSIDTQTVNQAYTKGSVVVAPHTDYAEHVELGTSRMPARPYMRTAYENKKDEAVAYVEGAVKDEISNALGGAGYRGNRNPSKAGL